MSIVVVGSIAFDDVVTSHKTVNNALGGSALYFATAASHFTDVAVIGVVGDDFPVEELAFLKERGVNLDGVQVVKGGKTFRWGGEYESDMNKRRTTLLELNVFETFSPVLSPEARKSPFVFLGNIDPDLQLDVYAQMESPRFVAADTIECYLVDKPDQFRKVLERINLLIVNDSEALLFTQKSSTIAAARELLKTGPQYVIVKKGEHGSILVSKDMFFAVPAYPVENVVDPTGAGDSYAGGVMGYIAKKGIVDDKTVKEAVVYGGLVASFLVEGFSLDTLKTLTDERLEERMTAFRKMTSF